MKAAGGGRVDRLGQLCHVVNLFDGLLDIIAKKLVSNWHRRFGCTKTGIVG